MMFWRNKKRAVEQEREAKEDKLLHHRNDPAIEPAVEYDAALDPEFVSSELAPTETDIIETTQQQPTPAPIISELIQENHDLRDDTNEGGWLSRLTRGLTKSSGALGSGIADIFTKKKLDADSLEQLEDLLIMSDLGPKTAAKIVANLSAHKFDKEIDGDSVKEALATQIAAMIEPVAVPLTVPADKKPFVMLICGVNGAGKTTTIGKLAYKLHVKEHRKVMVAAGDTFRAAAIEQLGEWAKRAHVPIVQKDIGADAAAVAFEAYEQAKAEDVDVLMIDTAGRLQNKANLMAELEKIVRVLKKQDESLPHAVLLVLDATTGQNAHSQVKVFKEAVDVTGLIVTKLDGSAKGGVVVSLAQEFGLPIHMIGVGEGENHLSPFAAKDFARALLGISH